MFIFKEDKIMEQKKKEENLNMTTRLCTLESYFMQFKAIEVGKVVVLSSHDDIFIGY